MPALREARRRPRRRGGSTISRITSRGVKCSPAVSFESSEKRADQLLVEVAHLEVRDGVRVQVDLRELRDDEVEQVRALEPVDLRVEAELLDHVARAGREAGDVRRAGCPATFAGSSSRRRKSSWTRVVELLARDATRAPARRSRPCPSAPRAARARRPSSARARSRAGAGRRAAGSPARTRTACRRRAACRRPTR